MSHLLSRAVLLWSIIYVIPSITCTVTVHGVSLKFQPTPFHPQAIAAEHVSDSHSVSQPEKEESHRARRPVNYLPLGSASTDHRGRQPPPLHHGGAGVHTNLIRESLEENYFRGEDDYKAVSSTDETLLKDRSDHMTINKNSQKTHNQNDQASSPQQHTRKTWENYHTNDTLDENEVQEVIEAPETLDDLEQFCPDENEINQDYSKFEELDVFACSSCTCIRDSINRVMANCTGQHLWDIPYTLPKTTYFINMSYNSMRSFNTNTVMLYPELVTLDLRQNKISRIYGIPEQPVPVIHPSFNFLNLYFNNVTYIEDGAFSSFRYMLNLQLSMNKITHITNNTFKGLSGLCRLDISKNYIKYIEDDAFSYFQLLEELFMNNQQALSYSPKNLKPVLFKNLIHLRKLHIHGFSHGDDNYPNEVLDQLTNLRELSVDGCVNNLFSKPSIKLHTLRFGPHAYCYFNNLTQEMFKNVPNLLHLSFTWCNFHNIDSDAFAYNTRLQSFSLEHLQTYYLENALEDLHKFPNNSLQSLNLIRLYHDHNCRVLSAKHGIYLQNLGSLKKLDLSDNKISLLRDDFLHKLPSNLTYLSLNKNRFDMDGNMWVRLYFLKHLEELDMSDQNIDWRSQLRPIFNHQHTLLSNQSTRPTARCTDSMESVEIVEYTNGRHERYRSTPDLFHNTSETSVSNCYGCGQQSNTLITRAPCGLHRRKRCLPPALKTVRASMYIGFGEYIMHMPNRGQNKLQNLSFPFTFMSSWGTGSLPSSVMYADFSHNPCSFLSHTFFPENNSLLSLNIRNNFFGVQFSEDSEGKLLSGLNKLRHLDISSNSIFSLPGDFLKGLSNLLTLDLSNNKLRVLNLTLSHLKNVRTINFGQNAIHHITKETMDHLDEIRSRHYLAINFKDNSIPCTCEGIDILQWMSQTRVVLMNRFFLTCISAKGTVIQIGDIQKRVEKLQRECIAKIGFRLILAISGTITLLFIIAGLVYRNRWKLRYMKNRTLANWLGFKPKGSAIPHFKFDAYIVYHHEDIDFVVDSLVEELEKKRGHKVCIEDRDFIPGTFNTNNIICAIQNSTVTLLLATPASLASGDVEYAVQMAALEEYYSQSKRPVLQLLLYQDADEKAFSPNLQALLRKGRFLEHPLIDFDSISDEVMQGFWDRLSELIGHTSNSEHRPRLNPY